jgi:hypothetical protein
MNFKPYAGYAIKFAVLVVISSDSRQSKAGKLRGARVFQSCTRKWMDSC